MNFNIDNLLRKNIKSLTPYSSARDEYNGKEGVFLDANENAYGSPISSDYNRYPDPLQLNVKQKISEIKNVAKENIFLGNGSDEAIDLLYRAFCEPKEDNVIICPPTYGMYKVSANINDVNIINIPLKDDIFQLNVSLILDSINPKTKLIFICSPNNPTGNIIEWSDIKNILLFFKGLVVVDEAYIDYASSGSLIAELKNYPNLVILQTFSKSWGLAGIRVGVAFCSQQIIGVLNKIKPPYNINSLSQKILLEALENKFMIDTWAKKIIDDRERLILRLAAFLFVIKVYSSEANFILLKVNDPIGLYNYLITCHIIVRDRSKIVLCENCLRITIGTKIENNKLLESLKNYK